MVFIRRCDFKKKTTTQNTGPAHTNVSRPSNRENTLMSSSKHCQPRSHKTNYFTRKCDPGNPGEYTKTRAHELWCPHIGPYVYNNAFRETTQQKQ